MLNYPKGKRAAMRIEALLRSMHDTGVKRLLISDTKLIEYAIGHRFHVSERFIGLLLDDGKATLFLNLLFPYVNPNLSIVRFHDIDDPMMILAGYIEDDELSIDRNLASGFLLRLMAIKPGLKTLNGSFTIDRVRAKKSPDEQNKMRIASRINDEVMQEVHDYLKIGVTENDVAEFIIRRFNELADGVSFEPIVAFGDHTADPHALSGGRRLEMNMPVVIDMGCVKDGYCSDMTRSFFLGENRYQEIFATVRQANLAGIAAVRPGVRLGAIDAAARKIIDDAGYGEYFVHRLGHGIGMDVHEPFDVSKTSEIVAFEGMCFSIEPGIYIPGYVGVRIEDLVLVTHEGCEVLNAFPKDDEVIA
jgi:Xaa-Pro dipeptidase